MEEDITRTTGDSAKKQDLLRRCRKIVKWTLKEQPSSANLPCLILVDVVSTVQKLDENWRRAHPYVFFNHILHLVKAYNTPEDKFSELRASALKCHFPGIIDPPKDVSIMTPEERTHYDMKWFRKALDIFHYWAKHRNAFLVVLSHLLLESTVQGQHTQHNDLDIMAQDIQTLLERTNRIEKAVQRLEGAFKRIEDSQKRVLNRLGGGDDDVIEQVSSKNSRNISSSSSKSDGTSDEEADESEDAEPGPSTKSADLVQPTPVTAKTPISLHAGGEVKRSQDLSSQEKTEPE